MTFKVGDRVRFRPGGKYAGLHGTVRALGAPASPDIYVQIEDGTSRLRTEWHLAEALELDAPAPFAGYATKEERLAAARAVGGRPGESVEVHLTGGGWVHGRVCIPPEDPPEDRRPYLPEGRWVYFGATSTCQGATGYFAPGEWRALDAGELAALGLKPAPLPDAVYDAMMGDSSVPPPGPLARPSAMVRSCVNIRVWNLLSKAWSWNLVPVDKAEEFLADLAAAVGATKVQAHVEAYETASESGYRRDRDAARAALAEVTAERDVLVRIIARQT